MKKKFKPGEWAYNGKWRLEVESSEGSVTWTGLNYKTEEVEAGPVEFKLPQPRYGELYNFLEDQATPHWADTVMEWLKELGQVKEHEFTHVVWDSLGGMT